MVTQSVPNTSGGLTVIGGKPFGFLPKEDDIRMFRDTTPPAPDWIIEGLEPGDVGILSAAGATGKSMFCLSLAVVVASGKNLFGKWAVGGNPGDVTYLYAEDGQATMHRRMHALAMPAATRLIHDGAGPSNRVLAPGLSALCLVMNENHANTGFGSEPRHQIDEIVHLFVTVFVEAVKLDQRVNNKQARSGLRPQQHHYFV